MISGLIWQAKAVLFDCSVEQVVPNFLAPSDPLFLFKSCPLWTKLSVTW